MRTPARSVSALPLEFSVGRTQLTFAVPLPLLAEAGLTAMLKAGSALEYFPLLALMMMSAYVPVCVLLGLPSSRPFAMLKLAQAGLFFTENDSVLPSGSLAAGSKA